MTAAENVMVGRHLYERRNVLAHLLSMPSAARQQAESRDRALDLIERVGLRAVADRSAGSAALWRLEASRNRTRARGGT